MGGKKSRDAVRMCARPGVIARIHDLQIRHDAEPACDIKQIRGTETLPVPYQKDKRDKHTRLNAY